MKSNAMTRNIVLIFCFFLFSSTLSGDPVIIRGVDGTWLPVLVSSWIEKNNGVILKPVKDIDPQILRTKLLDSFPGMNIEIINRDLFFPSINAESLFSTIGSTDIGLSVKSESNTLSKNPDVAVHSDSEFLKPLRGDEVIKAEVEEISFDDEKGIMLLDISIIDRASTGKFKRYFGKQRLKVSFVLKEDGTVDREKNQNKFFSKILLLKKGSVLSFIPKEIDPSRSFVISSYYIENL
jgi:hypothetical protein